jgi:hypothetical protein
MPCRRVSFARLVAAGVVAALVGGCGLAEYEEKMQASLESLRWKSRFDALYEAGRIDDYPFKMSLPALFKDGDWFRPGVKYRDGTRMHHDRQFPPFLDSLPGLNRTGEAFHPTTDGNRVSYYCYLCVVDTEKEAADALAARLQKEIQAKLPAADDAWTEIECKNEDGLTVTWKRLRAHGLQRFDENKGNRENFKDLPGTFDLYLHEAGGYAILWGVRLPDALKGKVFLLDLAQAAAATLEIVDIAEPPQGNAPTQTTP